MAVLQLDELQPGMVLACDAICMNGRVLLRAGAELTEQHLRIFRTWGLSEADIEGVDEAEIHDKRLSVADPSVVEKMRAEIQVRFRHADTSHPMMTELYHFALEQAVEENQG